MVLVERAMGFVHPLVEQNKKRRDKTHDHLGGLEGNDSKEAG